LNFFVKFYLINIWNINPIKILSNYLIKRKTYLLDYFLIKFNYLYSVSNLNRIKLLQWQNENLACVPVEIVFGPTLDITYIRKLSFLITGQHKSHIAITDSPGRPRRRVTVYLAQMAVVNNRPCFDHYVEMPQVSLVHTFGILASSIVHSHFICILELLVEARRNRSIGRNF
jgi:hypothetical protein